MYVTSDNNVPMRIETHGKSVYLPRIKKNDFISTYEIIQELADEEVLRIHPNSRKCKFPHENQDLKFYKHYSYTTCVAERSIETLMKSCKCTMSVQEYQTGENMESGMQLKCICWKPN